jgi:hypothetical protein
MSSPINRLVPVLFMSTIVGTVDVPASAAEDFTFDVPVQIVVSPSGAHRINAKVECFVSSVRHPDGTISALEREIVARGNQFLSIDPVSGRLDTVVTLRMNAANPRLLPASRGQFYSCAITDINYYFDESLTGVSLSGDFMEPDYERLTGLRFSRIVRIVTGEIAR